LARAREKTAKAFPDVAKFYSRSSFFGQFIQEGERNMFETFLLAEKSEHKLIILVPRRILIISTVWPEKI